MTTDIGPAHGTAARRRSRCLAVVAAASVGLAGMSMACGPSGGDQPPVVNPSHGGASTATGPPTATHSTAPRPVRVDFGDATAVCDAFANALLSGNPTRESRDGPVYRAGEYVTADYRPVLVRTAPRLTHWEEWGGAGVTRLRHLPLPDVEEETRKGSAARQYRVAGRRVVPTDASGTPLARSHGFVVTCTLTVDDSRWLVDDHDQRGVDPS